MWIEEIYYLCIDVANLRPNNHHIAIGHCTHTNQEVRQRHTKLEPAKGTLVVVVAIEED